MKQSGFQFRVEAGLQTRLGLRSEFDGGSEDPPLLWL